MEEFWGIDREDDEILPEGFDERVVTLEAANERTTMVQQNESYWWGSQWFGRGCWKKVNI